MSLIFGSLLAVNPDDELVPDVATALPTVSPDATTFTYHLRPGLKWSDGQPFSCQDVLYTYNVLANADSGSAAAGTFSAVEGYQAVADGKATTLSGFSCTDPNTFVVKASSPNIGLTALIGTEPLLPKHVLSKFPTKNLAKNAFFNKPTVGLGPYTFVTYKTDQYVELKANPHYRTPVHIATIYLKPVTTAVGTAQLGNGEMDLMNIEPADLSTVKAMKGVKIASKNSFGYIQLDVNQDKSYFKDPRVRQAMMYAINRKAIVDQALKGQGSVPNSSFVIPSVLSKAKLMSYPYDPDKAKQLLKAAGWNPSQKVVLEWIPGQSDRDTAATVVQAQLQAVGMNVQLKQVQAAELLNSIGKARTYDMLLGGAGNRPPDPWTIYNVSGCDAFYPTDGANVTHFCDKKFDALMKKANQTPDQDQRTALYAQAAKISNNNPAFVWLYRPKLLWAYSTKLHGYQPSGSFIAPFWNVANWTITG